MELGLENPLGKTEALFSSFNPPGPEVSNDSFQFEKANSWVSDTPVPGRFSYAADTSQGISGSPVWYWDEKSRRRYLITVHHGGCGNCETSPGLDGCTMQWVGESCMSDPKIGVLLMQQVVRQVRGWINEDYDAKRDIAL
jgi:V8-like Glu-specific endopeptidase